MNKLILALFFAVSCSPKSKLNDAKGEIKVKIPLSSQDGDSTQYQMSVVTLKGLYNLKEVAGFFVKFFYSPGLNESKLVGDSPQARFTKTRDSVYIPIDSISQQMATIYYHIQNLSELSQKMGVGDMNTGPMKIGIETQVSDSEVLSKNNAFYDGQSDAMLFVPYSSSELPIAVNSGIIAHEYFHSLFFKIVLRPFERQAEKSTSSKISKIFNQTYLRGINEGIADFWGWLYTNDDDFIRWSLSAYSKNRKLVLSEQQVGQFQTSESILLKVEQAVFVTDHPSTYLGNYIYQIGTPHARFLKQLTVMLFENQSSPSDSKLQMAKVVVDFLKDLSRQSLALTQNQMLSADLLFDFIASEKSKIKMTEAQCKFVLSYISKNELRSGQDCQKNADGSFDIKTAIQDIEKVVSP